MNNIIAITVGDIKGVGIKILINECIKNKITNFILFSDVKIIKKYLEKNKIKIPINLILKKNNKVNFIKNKLNIFSYRSNSSEDNTFKSLKIAYDFCKKKICIGIITLPLRKDLIKKKISNKFIGHTEYFQNLDKKNYSNMILYHNKIIISSLSTHIELKKVPQVVTKKQFLYNQIINLAVTLQNDFNIKKPRLLISGLNPHAGEKGEIGDEEEKFIKPIINKLRKRNINIQGPYSADSLLINENINIYDCFIFLYHDQALIPFKLISQFSGVNYTGNLNIIRTSPDHGTAYNLINSNKISNKSFLNCFKLVRKIYKNRKLNGKS